MDFQKLHERVQATARIRFNAARRLRRQYWYSQWTVSLLSVALILVSLWTALNLPVGFSAGVLTAMQVFFAVLVLVYSLLLSLENYPVRSERMHDCALELGRLTRKLEVHIGVNAVAGTRVEYDALAAEYYAILHRYENHEVVDHLRNRINYAVVDNLKGGAYARVLVTMCARYLMEFAHYVLITLFIFIFIWWMIFKAPA